MFSFPSRKLEHLKKFQFESPPFIASIQGGEGRVRVGHDGKEGN